MSTYRKRTQPKPTTAAGLRAQASARGNSIFRNRPRSINGLFSSSNQNSYSNLLGNSSYSTPSFLNKPSPINSNNSYNTYSNSCNKNLKNFQKSYTTYGGTASGYGALTLPSSHSSLSSLNLASQPTIYNSYFIGLNNRPMPSVHRGGSFNKPKPNLDLSSFGSRSSSLQSLAGSEGYVVRYTFN